MKNIQVFNNKNYFIITSASVVIVKLDSKS